MGPNWSATNAVKLSLLLFLLCTTLEAQRAEALPIGNTGGCISIFEQVLTVNYVTTVNTFTAVTTINIGLIVITMVSSVTVG